MKARQRVFIVTKFKEYDSTDEKYTFAEVHSTREGAEKAMRHMIEADVDADIEDSEDVSEDMRNDIIENAVEAAITEGENAETHDAILYYGDISAYYDIFQTYITTGEEV